MSVSLAAVSFELPSDASAVSETTSEESPVSERADNDLRMASIADEPFGPIH